MVNEGSVKSKRKVGFWHVAGGALVILAIGGWAGGKRAASLAKERLENELARLKSMGIPTMPAELRKSIDVNENAATDYKKAIDELSTHNSTASLSRPPSMQGRDAFDSSEFQAWVKANAETLNLVEVASQKSLCDFNRDWQKGAALDYPEVPSLRSFASLATAKAHYAAQEKDFGKAFYWLAVARKIGRHVREPALVCQLVSVAIEGTVLAEVQRETVLNGSDPKFRQKALQFLDEMGDLPSLRQALVGECVSTHVTLTQVENGSLELGMLAGQTSSSGGDPDVSPKFKAMAFKLPGVLQDAQATVLSSYRQAIEAMGENPNDYKAVMEASRGLDSRTSSSGNSLSGELAAIFFPTYAQSGSMIVRTEAMRRLTRCGIELYAAKGATDAFPSQIKQARWSVDPFTEKPFVYRPSGGGFALYSVGLNGVDDGGRGRFMHPMAPKAGNDDIEFVGRRR